MPVRAWRGASTPVMVALSDRDLSAGACALLPFALVGVALGWRVVFCTIATCPREHAGANERERGKIDRRAGCTRPEAPGDPMGLILRSRQMWTLAATYFCYGYCAQHVPGLVSRNTWTARAAMTLTEMGILRQPALGGRAWSAISAAAVLDDIIHRTGRIKFARQSVAISRLLASPAVCVSAGGAGARSLCQRQPCSASGVFGLELVVGNAWAVILDIGGNFAGSCSAVMNTAGQYRRHHRRGGHRLYRQRLTAGTMAFYVVSALARDRRDCCFIRRSMPAAKLAPDCHADWRAAPNDAKTRR